MCIRDREYSLGEAKFTVVAPNSADYSNSNNYSIGILLEYGENKFLFVGDAEEESEEEMMENDMDLNADVYKVSHHGSSTGTVSYTHLDVYKRQVQETVKDYMKEYVDEVRTDEMGNAVCVLHPEHPVRIMLSAHADEIGLIVTRITAEGRIQAVERGGIIHGSYPGQKVQIQTRKGVVYGVVEGCRETFRKKDLKAEDFLIDIGAASKEDAEQYVSLGDTIVLDSGVRKLVNGRITSRALDDKIGVFIIMEALKLSLIHIWN